MPHNILIRLENQAQQPSLMDWLIIYDNDTTQSDSGSENIDELARLAETAQKIIVLVPSMDVLLTHVTLPKLSPARLAKAIPYALEDQLSEDPKVLHFALGTWLNGKPLPVAVVSKDRMTTWRSVIASILDEGSSHVQIMLPDLLAIPWKPGSFQILIDSHLALVRTGPCAGFTIEIAELFPMLLLILKQPEQPKPDVIHIYHPSSVKVITEGQASQLGVPIQVASPPDNLLTFMSQVFNEPIPLNLLQGSYSSAQKKATMEQLIWAGFAIVSVWLLFQTLINSVSYFTLHQESQLLKREMQSIYAMIYPKASIPNDPKARLQKELNNMRASRSESAFIRLLQTVEPPFAILSKLSVAIQGMTYRNNQLILEVEAADSGVLDQLRLALETQGLKVVVSNAERHTNGLIETRLIVEEITR